MFQPNSCSSLQISKNAAPVSSNVETPCFRKRGTCFLSFRHRETNMVFINVFVSRMPFFECPSHQKRFSKLQMSVNVARVPSNVETPCFRKRDTFVLCFANESEYIFQKYRFLFKNAFSESSYFPKNVDSSCFKKCGSRVFK